MNRILICTFLLLCTLFCQAQPTLDTIRSSLRSKPRLYIKADTRNSFIENSRAQVIGIKCGIHYGKRLYFGIGYNQLYRPAPAFDKIVHFTDSALQPDSIRAKLNMYYISAHAEYIFHQAGRWRLSMPLQFGIGKTNYKYRLNTVRHTFDDHINFIYEPSIAIEYKLMKWLGLGADAGFRFMVSADRTLNRNFTSPIYAFRLQLYYSELLKSAFPKKDWANKL